MRIFGSFRVDPFYAIAEFIENFARAPPLEASFSPFFKLTSVHLFKVIMTKLVLQVFKTKLQHKRSCHNALHTVVLNVFPLFVVFKFKF